MSPVHATFLLLTDIFHLPVSSARRPAPMESRVDRNAIGAVRPYLRSPEIELNFAKPESAWRERSANRANHAWSPVTGGESGGWESSGQSVRVESSKTFGHDVGDDRDR